MDPETRQRIEARIWAINEEVGLLEPAQLASALAAPAHDFERMEELYTEREQLLHLRRIAELFGSSHLAYVRCWSEGKPATTRTSRVCRLLSYTPSLP